VPYFTDVLINKQSTKRSNAVNLRFKADTTAEEYEAGSWPCTSHLRTGTGTFTATNWFCCEAFLYF